MSMAFGEWSIPFRFTLISESSINAVFFHIYTSQVREMKWFMLLNVANRGLQSARMLTINTCGSVSRTKKGTSNS